MRIIVLNVLVLIFSYSFLMGQNNEVIDNDKPFIPTNLKEYIQYERNGFFIVKQNNLLGVIDKLNKSIIPIEINGKIYIKDEGILVTHNNKSGYYNLEGEKILPIEFDKIFIYQNGIVTTNNYENEKLSGLYSKSGKQILKMKYCKIIPLIEPYFAVSTDCSNIAIFDSNSSTDIIIEEFQNAFPYKNKFIRIQKNDLFGILNTSLKEIIPIEYSSLKFAEEYLIAENKNGFGIIDTANTVLIEFEYTEIKHLGAFYTIEKNNEIKILNKNLLPLTTMIYNKVEIPAYKQSLVVTQNNLEGVIDYNGDELLPIKYEEIIYHTLDFNGYIAKLNNKYGLYDEAGIKVLDHKYDILRNINGKMFRSDQNGKKGIVSSKGDVIVPNLYDKIEFISLNNSFEIHLHLNNELIVLNSEFECLKNCKYFKPY